MKIFVPIVIAVVTLFVVLGFLFGGSPRQARLERFDEIRLMNLQEIQYQVVEHFRVHESLPETLSALEMLKQTAVLHDPQTNESYTYRKTGERTFELCATFGIAQSFEDQFGRFAPRVEPLLPMRDDTRRYRLVQDSWSHDKGPVCFQREIEVIDQEVAKEE